VPLLAGAAVGRRCATGRDLPESLRALGVAGAVIALGGAVLGLLAGGQLGAAAFDPVDIPAGALAVALLAATLLGGCTTTLLLPCRRAQPEHLGDSSAQPPGDGSGREPVGDGSGQPPAGDGTVQ
jgi:hypothetical protein